MRFAEILFDSLPLSSVYVNLCTQKAKIIQTSQFAISDRSITTAISIIYSLLHSIFVSHMGEIFIGRSKLIEVNSRYFAKSNQPFARLYASPLAEKSDYKFLKKVFISRELSWRRTLLKMESRNATLNFSILNASRKKTTKKQVKTDPNLIKTNSIFPVKRKIINTKCSQKGLQYFCL